VWPRTVQDPHPPVFYSGNSEESAEFAGRMGLSIAIGFAPPPKVKQQVDIYKRAAREAGWEPTHDNVLYRGRMIIAETDSEANELAERMRAHAPATTPVGAPAGAGGGDPTAGVAGVQFVGGPDAVLQKARLLHDAGVGILDVAVAGGGMTRSLELFGRKFIPALAEVA
jgi:alkanesulfonate monooxygenase SsuD/methylene tetrahydromethanopterin reductase-like flavin-dependent oxidoreductase (luciferase family)